jgi:hypothetical protein
MNKTKREGGLAQKLLALALSALAAKIALAAIEQIWTRGLHKPIPKDDESSLGTKLAWMGVTAAAVGMAREMVRELTAPTVREEPTD